MSDSMAFAQDFLRQKYRRLFEVGDEMGAEMAALSDQFFIDLLDSSLVLMGVEAASIFFLREGKDELDVGLSTGARKEDLSRICIKLGIGVVGHAAKFDEVLVVNDPGKDMRFNRGFDRKTGFVTRNLLAYPFHEGSRVAGVLEFVNKVGRPFNDDDVAAVKGLFEFIGKPMAEALKRTSFLH
ncbi:MAG: GAF domain-containing protein [Deltaproteobacteria bacterium]|nr:GAF domain-containing protein [Deltaproteobacteria bacterium]